MIYSSKEVLKLLKISKPTLYKLCREKGIKPNLIGRRYRYTEFDLKRLLSNQGIDTRDLETKFVGLVNSIWLILVEYANCLWENGEDKLKEIMIKNKDNVFFMNTTTFREKRK